MLRRRPVARVVGRTAVVAGTAAVVGGHMANKQAAAAQAQQQSAPPAEPEPVQAAAPSADPIEQLKELAALKDQGVLTQEEFDAQKAKILG